MHDGIIGTYTITFTEANRCTVRVDSLVGGWEIAEEGRGTYSFDSDILKITAALRGSKIPHITGIRWASVISIGNDRRSFNMLAKPTDAGNNQVRVIFTKE